MHMSLKNRIKKSTIKEKPKGELLLLRHLVTINTFLNFIVLEIYCRNYIAFKVI